MSTPSNTVDTELRESFERDGFAVIRQFLSPTEFAELRQELDRYIKSVVPTLPETHAFYADRRRPVTLKQLQHMEVDSYFREYVQRPEWSRIATGLLGEPVRAQGCEWFNKPPSVNHPTPPHQDNFYFNLVPCNVLTMWLALEDVDQENGCLRYVRGSHLAGRRPHRPSKILGFSQEISDYDGDDELRSRATCLKANDLVIHHGWTIHSAEANRSSSRHRPSFAIVFRGVSCEVDQNGLRDYQRRLSDQHRSMGIKSPDAS